MVSAPGVHSTEDQDAHEDVSDVPGRSTYSISTLTNSVVRAVYPCSSMP